MTVKEFSWIGSCFQVAVFADVIHFKNLVAEVRRTKEEESSSNPNQPVRDHCHLK